MNNVLAALTSIAILFAGPSFGDDTNVSSLDIKLDESTGQPDHADLKIDAREVELLGFASLTCSARIPGVSPTPPHQHSRVRQSPSRAAGECLGGDRQAAG